MQTTDVELDPVIWTEIANGGSFVVFDILTTPDVEVFFNESATAPAEDAKGVRVASWGRNWDFEVYGLTPGVDRVWCRGSNTLRVVR